MITAGHSTSDRLRIGRGQQEVAPHPEMVGERFAPGVSFGLEPENVVQPHVRCMCDVIKRTAWQLWKVPRSRNQKTLKRTGQRLARPPLYPLRGDTLIEVAEHNGLFGCAPVWKFLESREPKFMFLPSPAILAATEFVGLIVRNTDPNHGQRTH